MDLCFGRFSKLKTYFEIRTPVIGLSLSEWYSARINVWFSRYKKRYEMLAVLLNNSRGERLEWLRKYTHVMN